MLNRVRIAVFFTVFVGVCLQNALAYYSPEAGRFVSRDPIGYEAGDSNIYRYVFNSPANHTDRLGFGTYGDCVRRVTTGCLEEFGPGDERYPGCVQAGTRDCGDQHNTPHDDGPVNVPFPPLPLPSAPQPVLPVPEPLPPPPQYPRKDYPDPNKYDNSGSIPVFQTRPDPYPWKPYCLTKGAKKAYDIETPCFLEFCPPKSGMKIRRYIYICGGSTYGGRSLPSAGGLPLQWALDEVISITNCHE